MSDDVTTSTEATSNDNTTAATVTSEPTVTTSWTDDLPDDLKSNPSVTKFKDKASAVKGYIELEKSLGGRVKVPGEGATPEELNAFYNKLGRPETKDGYEFDMTAEGKDINVFELIPDFKAQVEQFADLAHQLGLPKATAQKLVASQTEALEAKLTALAEQKAKADEMLAKTWGDNKEANTANAMKAAEMLAKQYPEEMKAFQNSDAARNPLSMIMLAEINKLYTENPSMIPEGANTPEINPRAELDKIKAAGRDHPVWNNRHPDHKQAVEVYNDLYRQLYSQT